MTSWLVGLMISESIHRNFGITAVFRFHLNYVNYTFSMIFWAVLHTHCREGITGDDEITTFMLMIVSEYLY
ncbi:MAG: hypothetical protein AB1Z20_24140 [Desulfobacterales bacterium]